MTLDQWVYASAIILVRGTGYTRASTYNGRPPGEQTLIREAVLSRLVFAWCLWLIVAIGVWSRDNDDYVHTILTKGFLLILVAHVGVAVVYKKHHGGHLIEHLLAKAIHTRRPLRVTMANFLTTLGIVGDSLLLLARWKPPFATEGVRLLSSVLP